MSESNLGVSFASLVSRVQNGEAVFVRVDCGDALLHVDLGDDGDDPGGAGARGGETQPGPDTLVVFHTGEAMA